VRPPLELQPEVLQHQLHIRVGDLVEITEMFPNVHPSMEVVRYVELKMSTLLLQEPVDVPRAVRRDAERPRRHHLFEPLVEASQHGREQRGGVDLQLCDAGEIFAEVGEYWAVGGPRVCVELRDDLVRLRAHQHGRELDDLVEVAGRVRRLARRLEVDHDEVVDVTDLP